MMIAKHLSVCFALRLFSLSQEIQEYFICLNHLGG